MAIQKISATKAAAATVETVKEQAAQLVAAVVATDSALVKANAQGTKTLAMLRAALGQPAPIVAKVLGEVFSQLVPVAQKNVGKKGSSVEQAEEWRRLANSVAVMARRANGGDGAPLFGLFYIGLDKAKLSAVVEVIAKPTPADVRASQMREQDKNKAIAALSAPSKPAAKPAVTGADTGAKPVGPTDNHAPRLSAEQAVLAQVANWRAGELESLANALLKMAADQRQASAKKAPTAKAKSSAPKRGPVTKADKSVPVATAGAVAPGMAAGATPGATLKKSGKKEAAPTFKPTVADKVA